MRSEKKEKQTMSRNNNVKNNGNHRDKKATDRYRYIRNKGGAVTEDQRLLTRPVQPLVRPSEPLSREQERDEEHAFERALHLDFTYSDPWRVVRILSEFVNGLGVLAHSLASVASIG